MKKLICIGLASLLLTCSLSSCNPKNDNNTETDYKADYKDTVNAYTKIITDFMRDPKSYSSVTYPPWMDEELGSDLLSLYHNYGSALDGYCIKDINGDGVDELIFLNSHYWVAGLCTYVDGKVKFVKEFGQNGNGGAIDKYGNIYDSRCFRYLSWFESIQTLESSGELKDIIYYGVSGSESLNDKKYYKKVDGEHLPATREEIAELRKQYHKYATPGVGDDWINMTREHLTFIPFYTENEVNDMIISIFEDALSGKREVMWNHFYESIGNCKGEHGLIKEFDNNITYTDINDDGIVEAILHSVDNGYFILDYSFDYNRINMKLADDVPDLEQTEWTDDTIPNSNINVNDNNTVEENDSVEPKILTSDHIYLNPHDPSLDGIYADTINLFIEIYANRQRDPYVYDGVTYPEGRENELGAKILEMTLHWGSLIDGYCIKDINGDGTDELIFLGPFYDIYGLFTNVDGEIRFVRFFDNGAIDKNGLIYDCEHKIFSFSSWQESIQKLDSNGELIDIICYGSYTGDNSDDDSEYYKLVDGQYLPSGKAEIEEFKSRFRTLWDGERLYEITNLTKEHMSYTNFNEDFYTLQDLENVNSNSSSITDFLGTYDDICQPIIYVRSWDEYFKIPIAYGIKENGGVMPFYGNSFCASLTSETTGILFVKQANQDTKIDMITFTKGSNQYTVLTIDIPLSEEGLGIYELFCNFVDSQTGFLFVFEAILSEFTAQGGERLLLYKTEDGGKTWNYVECDNPIRHSLADSTIYASFINENTAIVSGRYKHAELLEDRSYITFDGGKSWESIAPLPYPEYEEGIYSELLSFDHIDGKYVMTVRVVIDGGGTNSRKEIHRYISHDLRSWELEGVPEKAVHFSSYDAVLYMYSIIAKNAMTYNDQINYKAMFKFNSELDEEWYNKLSNAALTLRPKDIISYGYEYIDINKDGTKELILTTGNDYSILAIFTMSNGKPVLLDAFWSRYHGHIDSDGLLHIGGSSGWDHSISRIYRLSPESDQLELVSEIGSDGHIYYKINFYKLVNNKKLSISEKEYNFLLNSEPFSNEIPESHPIQLFKTDPIKNDGINS